VRIFKTKAFARFSDKAGVSDVALCRAAHDADAGLMTADWAAESSNSGFHVPGRGNPVGFEC
jgi:hypothetical protein